MKKRFCWSWYLLGEFFLRLDNFLKFSLHVQFTSCWKAGVFPNFHHRQCCRCIFTFSSYLYSGRWVFFSAFSHITRLASWKWNIRINREGHLLGSLDRSRLRPSEPSRLWVSTLSQPHKFHSNFLLFSYPRYPTSIYLVVVDGLEKVYLAGFLLLLLFVNILPVWSRSNALPNNAIPVGSCLATDGFSCSEPASNNAGPGPRESAGAVMEFLPLMAISVYCAIGLVWGFFRLMFVYLNEDRTYQGQLSEIR